MMIYTQQDIFSSITLSTALIKPVPELKLIMMLLEFYTPKVLASAWAPRTRKRGRRRCIDMEKNPISHLGSIRVVVEGEMDGTGTIGVEDSRKI